MPAGSRQRGLLCPNCPEKYGCWRSTGEPRRNLSYGSKIAAQRRGKSPLPGSTSRLSSALFAPEKSRVGDSSDRPDGGRRGKGACKWSVKIESCPGHSTRQSISLVGRLSSQSLAGVFTVAFACCNIRYAEVSQGKGFPSD